MKLRVKEITGFALRDDKHIDLGVIDASGNIHTIEFSPASQDALTHSLLASGRDPLGPASRRIRPRGISRFQIDEDVGLSFLLTLEAGFHVILARPLADELLKLLETFDDPSTWDTGSKPH